MTQWAKAIWEKKIKKKRIRLDDKIKFLISSMVFTGLTIFVLAFFSDYLGHSAWIVGVWWGAIKYVMGFLSLKFWVFKRETNVNKMEQADKIEAELDELIRKSDRLCTLF